MAACVVGPNLNTCQPAGDVGEASIIHPPVECGPKGELDCRTKRETFEDSVLMTNTGNDMGISTQGYRSNKYNDMEWNNNNYAKYFQSASDRHNSEVIRNDSSNTMNTTEAITKKTQDDMTKKLGERIQDISFWKFELERAIQDMQDEIDLQVTMKRQLENALRSVEIPLHIASDNLNCRLRRQGIDLVEDIVEKALLQEVKLINNVQELLKKTIAKTDEQLENNRLTKQKMEMDWSDKKEALQIDSRCAILRNHHTNKQFFPGSANFQEIQSTPESWAQFTHDNIILAENERKSSIQLRECAKNILEDTSRDLFEQNNIVQSAFQKRLQELDDAKFRHESHLKKVCQEISDEEKNIEGLLKAIRDKEDPLKVAQTRLDARSRRPGVELCRDGIQIGLIQEVDEINTSITTLKKKLMEAQNSLKNLQDTRMCLEKEISNKINSIFIDRQKCLPMRERYPTVLRLQGYQ
ncbi:tektin-4-like [Octopus sinensis]|uniref:Tektin n=1 Tax=Octopus sinensis TaxID=2607531 RepID=A0A6P7TA30_9MOLL|nr:tektin-4-like [Octopus sinensis]